MSLTCCIEIEKDERVVVIKVYQLLEEQGGSDLRFFNYDVGYRGYVWARDGDI